MTEKITVKQLHKYLSELIKDGCEDYTIDVTVRYDNCEHIQPLGEICANISGTVNFITLRGAKEHEYR